MCFFGRLFFFFFFFFFFLGLAMVSANDHHDLNTAFAVGIAGIALGEAVGTTGGIGVLMMAGIRKPPCLSAV